MNTKPEILPQTPSGVAGEYESKEINMKCLHCGGSIIKKYDSIYCIQCSREPKQTHPTVTEHELQMHKRGEDSVRNRIKSAAMERGN